MDRVSSVDSSFELGLPREVFVARLEQEGRARHHGQHSFHVRMHDGELSADELRRWVQNHYYYEASVPLADACILSKAEDPEFRKLWIRRLQDQDGGDTSVSGLALWARLGEAVGVPAYQLADAGSVLPSVRRAVDASVAFVRDATLLDGVAASLTDLFAPQLMAEHLDAWERHYPWVDASALECFRVRLERARRDAATALDFVANNATTLELQGRCMTAFVRKAHLMWWLLDCIADAEPKPASRGLVCRDGAPRATLPM